MGRFKVKKPKISIARLKPPPIVVAAISAKVPILAPVLAKIPTSQAAVGGKILTGKIGAKVGAIVKEVQAVRSPATRANFLKDKAVRFFDYFKAKSGGGPGSVAPDDSAAPPPSGSLLESLKGSLVKTLRATGPGRELEAEATRQKVRELAPFLIGGAVLLIVLGYSARRT